MMPLAAAFLAAALGLIHVMLGTRKSPQIEVPVWTKIGFGLGGLAIMAAAYFIYSKSSVGLWVYGSGWLLIQLIAIYTGVRTFGKPRWSHHLVRFVIFGAVFALGYAAVS